MADKKEEKLKEKEETIKKRGVKPNAEKKKVEKKQVPQAATTSFTRKPKKPASESKARGGLGGEKEDKLIGKEGKVKPIITEKIQSKPKDEQKKVGAIKKAPGGTKPIITEKIKSKPNPEKKKVVKKQVPQATITSFKKKPKKPASESKAEGGQGDEETYEGMFLPCPDSPQNISSTEEDDEN